MINKKLDYRRKKYRPLRDRTLKSALMRQLGREFPRLGGPRLRELCADLILELIEQHLKPAASVKHGQVVWLAVSLNDPPRQRQAINDSELVAVILELSTAEDVQAIIDRVPCEERLTRKAVRLSQQAYEQGALLGNCDLSELLNLNEARVSRLLTTYEKTTGRSVPRRATLHDVGTGVTHKRIICWKRYAEGKSAAEVAQETYHSLAAVDRYLGQYDKVRFCRQKEMDAAQTAYALNCSVNLVEQYLAIDRLLEQADD